MIGERVMVKEQRGSAGGEKRERERERERERKRRQRKERRKCHITDTSTHETGLKLF